MKNNAQEISFTPTNWISVKDALPEAEGYYKVRFENGIEDEKPFRIRPAKNIHGFMTMETVTHWAISAQQEEYAEDDSTEEQTENTAPVMGIKDDMPGKKTFYSLSDNYDLTGYILDAEALADYLDNHGSVDRPADTVYTINLVFLTQEEFENLPEYQF